MSLEEKYKIQLAEILETDSSKIFLYWKGRVALYALLKSMKIGPGDEVILPAFTCVVVPNAILYLGATPIYVDIDPKVYNTTKDHIEAAITSKTKCILVQNTFGLSHQVEEITSLTREKGIFTIEDCTHGFGGHYNGKPNGTYCDAAFYSTQWNKPFSTGIGGFALINNDMLLREIEHVNKTLASPGWKQQTLLRVLLWARTYLLRDSTYWFLLKFYRMLSKIPGFVGSSSDVELTSARMPENYFMGASKVQMQAGIRALRGLNEQLETRKNNAHQYNTFLERHNKIHLDADLIHNHSFLKFPILVRDRKTFMQAAEKAKIQLGDWFLSPIHPVESAWEEWKLVGKQFPKAVEISNQVVNLPTDTKSVQRVLDFLSKNLDQIL